MLNTPPLEKNSKVLPERFSYPICHIGKKIHLRSPCTGDPLDGQVRIDSALKRVLNLKEVDNRKFDRCSRRFERGQKAIKRRRLAQIKGDLKSLVQSTLKFKKIGS